ncbi:unnamed protein product [Cylindrotheca closterium]|uniref:Uncharacterized protein n=1 Tax=Cylindrotheca closterium TaxID=2856 RepID=A0AAD2FRI0_9STRA|nr:unnamed protein product [Cylindrotheca closterium]
MVPLCLYEVKERDMVNPSRRLRRKRKRERGRTGLTSFTSSLSLMASVILVSISSYESSVAAYAPNQAFSRRRLSPFSLPQRGSSSSSSSLDMASQVASMEGLSPYFRGILSRTNSRQRFVTGRYPLIIDIQENPTARWLNLGRVNENIATTYVLVNETTIDRSLASYDRFQWVDEEARLELHNRYTSVSLELLAEVNIPKPGYLNILPADGPGASATEVRTMQSTTRWNRWRNSPVYRELEEIQWNAPYRDRLWVTGFTLTGRKGLVQSVDAESGHIDSVNKRSKSMTLWPNEVNHVPKVLVDRGGPQRQKVEVDDALLVSDGFLVPGKDRGGIYVIKNPSNPNSEWTMCLTDEKLDNWFYHRAVWVDLTGDGRKSILTARAKLRKVAGHKDTPKEEDNRPKNGQLVWLEMPEPHHFDESTGTPLEKDGTAFDPFSSRHLPWKERVLATGPDVMFNVVDMDTEDDTIEVIASQFFDKRVTLHSIKIGKNPSISFARTIDNRCGAAFGGIVANLDGRQAGSPANVVIDSGSTVRTLQPGDSFSHVLVTSHECNYAESEEKELIGGSMTTHHAKDPHHVDRSKSFDGGSLFSYRVPEGKDAWKSEPWVRTTVATGFKVKAQIWNVINPGAPGFVYTFHARKEDARKGKRPMIAIAGDCAESAYIFRPEDVSERDSLYVSDSDAQYRLMSEIRCGATVGSIAIGYDDLCSAEQESGYAKIYIPCYEKDKILVFAMGSGEEDDGW